MPLVSVHFVQRTMLPQPVLIKIVKARIPSVFTVRAHIPQLTGVAHKPYTTSSQKAQANPNRAPPAATENPPLRSSNASYAQISRGPTRRNSPPSTVAPATSDPLNNPSIMNLFRVFATELARAFQQPQ